MVYVLCRIYLIILMGLSIWSNFIELIKEDRKSHKNVEPRWQHLLYMLSGILVILVILGII